MKKKSLVGYVGRHHKFYFRPSPLGFGKLVATFMKKDKTSSYNKKVRITIEPL